MKLNVKLLKRLYLIDHYSCEENDMISFIINYCYKIPHLTFKLDSKRNLLITKNTTNPECYPCIVAHMDTIQQFMGSRELVQTNNVITARYIGSKFPCGLNADDCNGIVIALQLLETLPNLKVCFTVEEEYGGLGAKEVIYEYSFFYNISYFIQPDRHGSSDLITETNGAKITSPDFLKDIQHITDLYGYKPAVGTFTDVGIMCPQLGISGVNISCGYYDEHTNKESCNIVELAHCLNYIYSIINYLGEKCYDAPTQEFSSKDIPELPCDHCSGGDCINCKHYPI